MALDSGYHVDELLLLDGVEAGQAAVPGDGRVRIRFRQVAGKKSDRQAAPLVVHPLGLEPGDEVEEVLLVVEAAGETVDASRVASVDADAVDDALVVDADVGVASL